MSDHALRRKTKLGRAERSLTGRYESRVSSEMDTRNPESRLSRITVALNGGAAAYEEAEKGRSGQRNPLALVRAEIDTCKNVERGKPTPISWSE